MKIVSLKHYARALVQTTETENSYAQLLADLEDVADKMAEAPDLKKYLTDPHLSLTKKKQALKAIFTDFISPKTYNFIYLLIKDKRLLFLEEILALAKKERLSQQDMVEVLVESVVPVTSDQQQRIQEIISQKIKQTVIIKNIIKTELIGGLKLRLKDTVIDGSLQGQIDRLQKKIDELE